MYIVEYQGVGCVKGLDILGLGPGILLGLGHVIGQFHKDQSVLLST